MSPVVIGAAEAGAIRMAAEVIQKGGVVLVPTDTVYGIVSSPFDTARLFELKKRDQKRPVAVLASSLEEAAKLGELRGEALREAGESWPGALTIVVRRTDASLRFDLGGDPATIGLRVPNHPVTLELLHATGPLAATSANVSGEEGQSEVAELASLFGESVDLYLDAGRISGAPSKVVSYLQGPTVLRA